MKKFGKYRAVCVDVHDPEILGRIRVHCPEVYGDGISEWAYPNFPPNTFSLPSEGEMVWVEFEQGNPSYPIWTGVWYQRGGSPMQDVNNGIQDKTGAMVDTDKAERDENTIAKKERDRYRPDHFYDPTKHVLFESETGMQVWVDEDPSKDGGFYISDRAGNFYSITDNEESPFIMRDMNGNVLRFTLNGMIFQNYYENTLEIEKEYIQIQDKWNGNLIHLRDGGIDIDNFHTGNKFFVGDSGVGMKENTSGSSVTLKNGVLDLNAQTILLRGNTTVFKTVEPNGPAFSSDKTVPDKERERKILEKKRMLFNWRRWLCFTDPTVYGKPLSELTEEQGSNEDYNHGDIDDIN